MTETPEDRAQRRRERRYSRGAALDWFFFIFAGLASIWLAYLSLTESFRIGWWGLLGLIPIAMTVTNWCPLYALLHIDTLGTDEPHPPSSDSRGHVAHR